jgi:hypothetical protein
VRAARASRIPQCKPVQAKAPPSKVSAIQMSGDEIWEPKRKDEDGKVQPCDDNAYQALRTMIASLLRGTARDDALTRINNLDCSSSDKTLASCDPTATAPPEAATWREATLKGARVDGGAYDEALATVLRALVCENTIHVVRGEGFQERLQDAGAAASDLIDDLMKKESKDCPAAAALTDDDRANLWGIKQDIEKRKPGG